MARPKKLNADYFSHDKDMRNDPRIKAIRRKFSHVGYAVWNYILETLADADFFEIDWSEVDIEILSGDYDVTPELLKNVVDYCVKLELLQFKINEDGVRKLVCRKLIERFSDLLSKRERSAKNRVSVTETPETNEFLPQKPPKNEVTVAQNPQSKVKYSKVNISKDINISLSHSHVCENLENGENLETSINSRTANTHPPGSDAPPVAEPPQNLEPIEQLNAKYRRKGFPQQEAVMRAVPTHCRSSDDVWMWLDKFTAELMVKGDTHKTWADFQSHFINWMKLQKITPQINGHQSNTTHRTTNGRGDMSGSKRQLANKLISAQQEFEQAMAAEQQAQSTATAVTVNIP